MMEVLIKLLVTLPAFYAAFWFIMAFNATDAFNDTMGFNRTLTNETYTDRVHDGFKKHWFQGAVLVVGFATLGWFVSYGLIWWMPFDWGGYHEDGEFEPMRDTIRAVVAFVSVGMIGVVEKYVEPIRLAKLRAAHEPERNEKRERPGA